MNATTTPATDPAAVKALGTALPSILLFALETPPDWAIRWAKIDLSDGFWQMIVQRGQEFNFIYEAPPKPHDPRRWFVVPAALQMGWTNSPAYFCTATEAGRELARRLLAISFTTGDLLPHQYEHHCVSLAPSPPTPWQPPLDIDILLRVFVDDYVEGLAGPADRLSRPAEELWLCRAVLHAIHALFPPPSITGHTNGRDSISLKKLLAGDGLFALEKILLGLLFDGSPHQHRTVGLPRDKVNSYIDTINAALAAPRHYISRAAFQKLHGKIMHASIAMPCINGFMSVLNKALAGTSPTIGWANNSPLRATLTDMITLITLASTQPSHITELVGVDLPHIYGYTDASRTGLGGVLLPATHWLQPLVWRCPVPPGIIHLFDTGALSINDLEMAANFVAERILEHQLHGHCEGINSWLGADNATTVSWKRKRSPSSTARSTFAPQILRAESILQRFTRRGPQDIGYIQGTANLLGDFPSRSYDQGFPASGPGDESFLHEFTHRHPLPPQLGHWQYVRPTDGMTSAVFSMLAHPNAIKPLQQHDTGDGGLNLPSELANTLCSTIPRRPATTWNERYCSWPLLCPSGKVDSTLADRLRARKSRERYVNARSSWSPGDFVTLADHLLMTTN